MNRPNQITWAMIGSLLPKECQEVIDRIENYCNFLEWKLEATNEALNDHIKALDKACEKLAFASNEHIIEELGSFTLGEINRTKEQWKEWCMKDE